MKIDDIIEQALMEDLGDGDHTSRATIPANKNGKARLVIKQDGILAGTSIAKKVFLKVDPGLTFDLKIEDGKEVKKGDHVFTIEGPSRSILSGERLALNFMQRMSGIATNTRYLMDKIKGTKAILLDTRKTTPLMRELEKYAVRMGGGQNHRMGLYDMIMIKDNHVDFAGGIENAIVAVHQYLEKNHKTLPIEIEVRNFNELEKVLDFGRVDRIMLDNFTPENLKKAVDMIGGRFETEASGGITEASIREFAETGVDFISVGALTHQIRSLDMSLQAI
ncbi:MAG: carboxylating nicotinate-nucleotide diphosphorylase [Bacteroidetes bacterium]|nr:carboxylating nicotinate-nucleotide diphosphorylase [Bacteroidota bacterium]